MSSFHYHVITSSYPCHRKFFLITLVVSDNLRSDLFGDQVIHSLSNQVVQSPIKSFTRVISLVIIILLPSGTVHICANIVYIEATL